MPAGWDLTSATCSDGSDPGSISLAAGENVTCTFTNTKRVDTIVKQAVGGDGGFRFTSQTLGSLQPDDREWRGAAQLHQPSGRDVRCQRDHAGRAGI